MEKSDRLKLTLAVVVLGAAAFLGYRFFTRDGGITDKGFFYDLSERKLYVGSRTAVPPIKGTDGRDEDGMRAVVISTNGTPEDEKSWTVAYLEKYSSALKQQMENAQKTGQPPALGRAGALEHRFVRRLSDETWYPMSSPEAERIVSDWATPGPNGVTPVVCSP